MLKSDVEKCSVVLKHHGGSQMLVVTLVCHVSCFVTVIAHVLGITLEEVSQVPSLCFCPGLL